MLLDSFRTQTSCVHIISFFMRTPNLFIYLFIYFFYDLSLKTF